jgi:hypothetical protein
MALATSIKNLIANRVHPCHPKYRQIVNLAPWWRVSLSLNNRPDRLLVLPPMTDDIADKIILLRASKHPMPMSVRTAEQKETFWNTLVSELPAFLFWLRHEFCLPKDWQEDRFGVRSFHHPHLMTELEALSPAIQLLRLIDVANIWTTYNPKTRAPSVTDPWVGTALELRTRLLENPKTQRDAAKLLDWTNACGQYLNDLAEIRKTRVTARRKADRRWYEIFV